MIIPKAQSLFLCNFAGMTWYIYLHKMGKSAGPRRQHYRRQEMQLASSFATPWTWWKLSPNLAS